MNVTDISSIENLRKNLAKVRLEHHRKEKDFKNTLISACNMCDHKWPDGQNAIHEGKCFICERTEQEW